MTDGGYDSGYAACPCFWGSNPGSLVAKFSINVHGAKILDAGCGEGKNAFYFCSQGAHVTAIDCSDICLKHAKIISPRASIRWICADVRCMVWPNETFDVVVAYGLFHCLKNANEISRLVTCLQGATNRGGHHIIAVLNGRIGQNRAAHDAFDFCLLPHQFYVNLYQGWSFSTVSDEDLEEVHPHNGVLHRHSITRMIVKKP